MVRVQLILCGCMWLLCGCLSPSPLASPTPTSLPLPTAVVLAEASETPSSTDIPIPEQPPLSPTSIPTEDRPTATHTPAPPTATTSPTLPPPSPSPTELVVDPTPAPFVRGQVIGSSTSSNPIEAFYLGYGENEVVVVGGIHGGYEWNTILLSYELIDYFTLFQDEIPPHVTLIVIPSANPDGQALVTEQAGRFNRSQVSENSRPGRFNANGVDLNRNWDCQWEPNTVWGNVRVENGGGAGPYSERESIVLRQFIIDLTPQVVIFLHSAASGIFPGRCGDVQVPDTLRLAEAYSVGSGYRLLGGFNAYRITGESSDSLNLLGIPAFTVELHNHSDTDFAQNLGGIREIFATPLGDPIELELGAE